MSLLLSVGGCELDNYQAPNAGIKGKIIDSYTGKPLTTVEPHGFKIRLIELNKKYPDPKPIDFWGKANGTFMNTKLFADKYKVFPILGAFFDPEPKIVEVHGMTTVNFTVTPYLELTNVSVTPISNGVIVKYQIKKSPKSDKILISESMASHYPTVKHTVFDQKVTHDLSDIPDSKIVHMQFADTLTGLTVDHSGGFTDNTYYIRAAAKTDNPQNRFNYSKLFKITIQ